MDGSNGRGKDAPLYCRDCAPAAYKYWTQERVIAAMQRFAERYGRPPCATDFNPSRARTLGHRWRVDRFERDGDYPYLGSVYGSEGNFESWNDALSAAGLRTMAANQYPRDHGFGAHLEDEREAA